MKLSILIPVFNEQNTLEKIVQRVVRTDFGVDDFEVIIVDDGSTDSSPLIAKRLADADPRISAFLHEKNRGKGAAIRTALMNSTGDILVIQDGDLEYDPQELPRFIRLIQEDIADVVFGSRFLSSGPHRVLYFWHNVGNRFLTLLSNMMTNLNLTDMEVCYKAFRREVANSIRLEEERFGFEPEFTAKIAKSNWRIYEVPISYYGRTYEEGKKIGWRDGLRAVLCIIKYRFFSSANP